MNATCKFAIVGGGLAGLAAANALKMVGLQAEVFETAPELGEIGASVNISPQAVKALRAIGVGEAIAAVGHESPGPYTRAMQTGEFLQATDRLAVKDKYGAPYYSFHRADLIDALAKTLDPARIHLGHRLSGLVEADDHVTLNFQNGASVDADYVIGADGVKSAVREALYGEDRPAYTGQMVWRALLKTEDVPEEAIEPRGHTQWVGPGRHLIAYKIRQGKLVNVVSQVDTDEWVEEGWSIKGDPADMRASFPGAEPRLAKLLDCVGECTKWGLFTRPINDNWGRGRIQMIGDAAHAMLPSAGQGAAMAFEDAYILGRWLGAVEDPVEAFAEFRRIRIPRVHGVQRLSLANKDFKHMKDSARQKEAIKAGTGSVHGKIDWVWGFDPAAEWDRMPDVPPVYADPAPAAAAS
ncbi:FAD-dependent monooxygenase [Jiella sonneratiae]|uniref:FAD-dependent monooxygenase n=1 Tax=Jiella sonneratiae TaxID=2816856 RepID=A0ABS3J8U8_9HYPH|nr:FAD-dependent monooxygenase [Jiella sonneratiae]MBO0906091.1 FAD-dependent monooxygenase [Jiella sonneratiae]